MTDAYRDLEAALARRRRELEGQLETTLADERALRAQIDVIDRQLGRPRRPHRRRRIVWAAWLGVSATLFGGLAYRHYVRDLQERERQEATQVIGEIMRGAVAHYERTGQLCPSAPMVPAEGVHGSDTTAFASWDCVGFDVTKRRHHSYAYNVGGNYLAPARGGIDPGPNGFEVAAVRDLDGDGKTTLITRHGVVKPHNNTLVRSESFAVATDE